MSTAFENYMKPSNTEPFPKATEEEVPDPEEFINKAKFLVAENFNKTFVEPYPSHDHLVKAESKNFYVVWFSKTLKNWKALVSTDLINSQYWEVTHNGEQGETYVDHYKKSSNAAYSDQWFENARLS
jgi:Family of unknown function (DUF6275)